MNYLNAATRRSAEARELIYVLIDFSPSMDTGDYQPSRKLGAIEANRRLIEAKVASFPDDQIGIIAFAGKARCLHRSVVAGAGCEQLYRSLRQDVSISGGTDFSAALKLAHECLFGTQPVSASPGWLARMFKGLLLEPSDSNPQVSPSPRVDDSLTKRIIMLTDGEHNGYGDPVKIAGLLHRAGVIIECVGIAGSPREVDEAMLKRIASRDETGKPRYYFIGDTSGLIRKYKSMANQIRPAQENTPCS